MVDDSANVEDFAFGDGDDDVGVPLPLPYYDYHVDCVVNFPCAGDTERDDVDEDDKRVVENLP